jgi:tetratricopeptide (TPR) repeat protein
MKRFILFILFLATLINSDLFSQSKSENKHTFLDAESWILFEDYKEALPKYQQLLKLYPDNSNFKYRIGQCYLNTSGEKEKAISYLEDAVKNINADYKEGKFRETGAPYDALYYLANAYRINNQLDKALKTYEQFKKNLNSEVFDSNIVNLQIQSCYNSKELMKIPLFIKEQNLGNQINGSNSEFNPVISDKEDLIVFSRSQAFYDAILFSAKVNGQWSGPINMNELLRVDKDLYPTSISKDGKSLYMYSSADYDGIIYTSQFENGVWAPPVKLNENINTKYWESHATISHDNKKLYFTTNRKGTLGGLDIYVSNRDSTGDWGPAINLGPLINTPYNEESPFLSEDDKTLFFSSRGHFNMGGYDIFFSTLLQNGEWSAPLNLGYPMNTTDDDVFFYPLKDGYEGYYAKGSPGGLGKQDIYRIEIFSDNHPRIFFVRGMVKVADLISIKDSVKISTMNIKDQGQTIVVYSNPKTGEYDLRLPQGNYQIAYEAEKSEKVVRKFNLPITNPSDSFLLPSIILPKTDFVADLIVLSDKRISVVTGDSILLPLIAERNSSLTVEHWVGDSLVSVGQFFLTDSTFNYKMVPAIGDNKVVFKLQKFT